MRNIALCLAYEGGSFSGWQSQPGQRTIEQELLKSLETLHRQPVKLYAAGRTDTGVHAGAQTVNFRSPIPSGNLPAERFREALNRLLPQDLRVLSAREVPDSFHSRYSAKLRTYRYVLTQSKTLSPGRHWKAWYVDFPPQFDLKILNSMIAPLLGEQDFTSFAAARDQSRHKIRRIESVHFYFTGPYLVFQISGNAFLWHMVRSIVGTVISLYSQKYRELLSTTDPQDLPAAMRSQGAALRREMELILRAKDRKRAGFTAPARGLTLHEVSYTE